MQLQTKFLISFYQRYFFLLQNFRIQLADEQYKAEFQQELEAFKARIAQRAQDKLDAAVKEIEEAEKQKRLGPGGLDPVEVYESLPEVIIARFMVALYHLVSVNSFTQLINYSGTQKMFRRKRYTFTTENNYQNAT